MIYTGIVLKKTTQYLILLDSKAGKKTVFLPAQSPATGSCFLYQHLPRKRSAISIIETLFVPFALAHDDILFLHHILELSFYFLPEEVPSPAAFLLINSLYLHPQRQLPRLFKKVFSAQLLIACGEYPAHNTVQIHYLETLTKDSVDIIMSKDLDLNFEHYLDEWLHACVHAHPHIEQFKTLSFLAESRTI